MLSKSLIPLWWCLLLLYVRLIQVLRNFHCKVDTNPLTTDRFAQQHLELKLTTLDSHPHCFTLTPLMSLLLTWSSHIIDCDHSMSVTPPAPWVCSLSALWSWLQYNITDTGSPGLRLIFFSAHPPCINQSHRCTSVQSWKYQGFYSTHININWRTTISYHSLQLDMLASPSSLLKSSFGIWNLWWSWTKQKPVYLTTVHCR